MTPTSLNQNAYVIIASFGIAFIMMSGNMDLSIGYQMSVIGILVALLVNRLHMNVVLVIICGIIFGIVFSLLNWYLSFKLNIPRIMVTFGTMPIFQGLAYVISKSKSIGGFTDDFKFFGQGTLFGLNITIPLILVVVFFFAVSFVFNHTYFGRYVYAMGGNKEAARLAGISVNKTMIWISVIAGAFLGLASTILTSRVGAAMATSAVGTEFTVISGIMLGGVSVRGGEGKLHGVLAGTLIIVILANGMQLANIDTYYQYVAKGIIMLAAIGYDVFQLKRRSMVKKNARLN